jgi:hypothetical protein
LSFFVRLYCRSRILINEKNHPGSRYPSRAPTSTLTRQKPSKRGSQNGRRDGPRVSVLQKKSASWRKPLSAVRYSHKNFPLRESVLVGMKSKHKKPAPTGGLEGPEEAGGGGAEAEAGEWLLTLLSRRNRTQSRRTSLPSQIRRRTAEMIVFQRLPHQEHQ